VTRGFSERDETMTENSIKTDGNGLNRNDGSTVGCFSWTYEYYHKNIKPKSQLVEKKQQEKLYGDVPFVTTNGREKNCQITG